MYKVEDNYQTSEAFGSIDSQLSMIETIIREFLTDGISLVVEKQKMMDDLLEKIKKTDNETFAAYEQHEHEPARLENISLKNTFLSSSLNYSYSQFEFLFDQISRICDELFDANSSEINDNNSISKKTKTIEATKNYLVTRHNINLADSNEKWETISHFRKIRNCFTHSNGNIQGDNDLRQHIERTPNISLSNDDIILTKEFIIDQSKILINYLRIVMEILYEKKKAAKTTQ